MRCPFPLVVDVDKLLETKCSTDPEVTYAGNGTFLIKVQGIGEVMKLHHRTAGVLAAQLLYEINRYRTT